MNGTMVKEYGMQIYFDRKNAVGPVPATGIYAEHLEGMRLTALDILAEVRAASLKDGSFSR